MATEIKCPNCGHEFEPTDSIREEVQRELRTKMSDWQKQQQQKFDVQLQEEKNKTQKETEELLRKSISSDFENKLRIAEQSSKDNEEKLKEARKKELEFLVKEQALLSKEQELDLQLQKMLITERSKLSEIIRKEETDKISLKETEYVLKNKELEEKLDTQKKLVDEMKRKSEQGSMQLQGEVQELLIQETLQATFPFDEIEEVGKGKRGADCIQVVRNKMGNECGKIYYESKRAENFGGDWIEKLKDDMRRLGTDAGVIVTKTLPKDVDRFGQKDGIWICTYADLKGVALMLRDGIIKVFNASKSQENKGDKMHMLYDYLTSTEFSEQWKAIREGFMSMKLSIQKERDAMEKLWKQREKQLEKVLLNAAHIRGSVEGIAGNDVHINLLEDDDLLSEE